MPLWVADRRWPVPGAGKTGRGRMANRRREAASNATVTRLAAREASFRDSRKHHLAMLSLTTTLGLSSIACYILSVILVLTKFTATHMRACRSTSEGCGGRDTRATHAKSEGVCCVLRAGKKRREGRVRAAARSHLCGLGVLHAVMGARLAFGASVLSFNHSLNHSTRRQSPVASSPFQTGSSSEHSLSPCFQCPPKSTAIRIFGLSWFCLNE
ncbi:hypothetical protein BD413DRAFT_186978 [Trametes elegans]|nr:hypothetical protein BD413DRAFT_186978 [Trametes elegans]